MAVMISLESPPQRPPKPIAATCARQQHENNQVTTQSSQKTQSAGGSYGRRGGSGHIRSQASLRGGHTTVLPMRRGRVSRQVWRGSAKVRRAKDACPRDPANFQTQSSSFSPQSPASETVFSWTVSGTAHSPFNAHPRGRARRPGRGKGSAKGKGTRRPSSGSPAATAHSPTCPGRV